MQIFRPEGAILGKFPKWSPFLDLRTVAESQLNSWINLEKNWKEVLKSIVFDDGFALIERPTGGGGGLLMRHWKTCD